MFNIEINVECSGDITQARRQKQLSTRRQCLEMSITMWHYMIIWYTLIKTKKFNLFTYCNDIITHVSNEFDSLTKMYIFPKEKFKSIVHYYLSWYLHQQQNRIWYNSRISVERLHLIQTDFYAENRLDFLRFQID